MKTLFALRKNIDVNGLPQKRSTRVRNSTTSIELPRVISLFSGAGGLDLGFRQAGFKISLAIDLSDAAIRTHKKNFPDSISKVGDLIKLQPEGVVSLVQNEIPLGQRIAVIGGPPCQGFSRANPSAQADDPRNELPQLYLEIVEALQKTYQVDFIVIENVLGIRDRKHAATFNSLKNSISKLGLDISEHELCALDYGVPQNRKRVILVGLLQGQGYGSFVPQKSSGPKTVRETIGGLASPIYFKPGLDPTRFPVHPNHWTMQPKSPRFSSPDIRTQEGRSFRRLKWDAASPTIAFGHREIHVHPNGERRLSIYEALLLQGFPNSFILEGNLSEQVLQVSNAVPPPLAFSVATGIKCAIQGHLK